MIDIERRGRISYSEAWDYQHKIFEERRADRINDRLLLVEHDPVVTIGKTGSEDNLLFDKETLEKKGIELFHIDRGGDITFHGLGQIVGYPVLRLENYYRDVHRYLRDIEEVIIRTLAEFEIEGWREEGMTGVWTAKGKIAAIGVKVSRWITMHGFALNVNTELDFFKAIVPCGITGKPVTSMEDILGVKTPLKNVEDIIVENFINLFSESLQKVEN